MFSISIQEVANFPPEPRAEPEPEPEPAARPCSCHAREDDAPSSLQSASHAGIDAVADEEGDEDEYGFHAPKPKKMSSDVDYNFHEKIQKIRETYDMYLDFLGTCAYSRAPWIRASEVVRAKEEVDQHAHRLEEQLKFLESKVGRFSQSVSHNIWYDWYLNIDDLTAYSVENLARSFSRPDEAPSTDVPWMDIWFTHHFVQHLLKTLPETLEHARPSDERTCHMYAQKLMILLNAIAKNGDWNHTMHFALFLKTKMLRRRSNRWTCLDYLSHQNMLAYTVWSAVRQGHAEKSVQFWDFAFAWRELWNDWQTWDIFERFHVSAIKHRGLLLVIYESAAGEVRRQCQIALEKLKLPTELVLLITEHTMLASGIPLSRPGLG